MIRDTLLGFTVIAFLVLMYGHEGTTRRQAAVITVLFAGAVYFLLRS